MSHSRQKSTLDIRQAKHNRKLVMLTAYDYTMAKLLDQSKQVDMLLVGDTLSSVVQGLTTTIPVTLEQIIYHSEMVARATEHALVIADLPFGSYQQSPAQALNSAVRVMKEAGVNAVKLEGGSHMEETIHTLTQAGIPVMAHLGLTPQSVHQLGGYKVQGRDDAGFAKLVDDARAVSHAGAFAVVLEAMPVSVARQITETIPIPTIGIGAGIHCDGQVLVVNDMLGLNSEKPTMKFNREYCVLRDTIGEAVRQFSHEVVHGMFPDESTSYKQASGSVGRRSEKISFPRNPVNLSGVPTLPQ